MKAHRFAVVLVAACEATTPPPAIHPAGHAPAATAEPAQPVEVDPRFSPVITRAAQAYAQWGKVDDTLRIAPAPCAAPAPPDATSHERVSRATSGPHAKKVYYLFASDRDRYTSSGAFESGFVVVKQSFSAATHEPTGLFVIAKVGDGAGDGTDQGWIYGTVAVDGTVTSAGRVGTCMECHDRDAKHERLFGLAAAR